ncbi:biotin-dependent enzyme [Blastococcus colisei]|uniref:Biotin-dependent enzyme n=1 Tax=Blastococcus colisei TaxID=1564162 RepID=A0A543PG51_9ACTN|nr:biotin/lipoyl-containing protein [Blastococcus colisei]TQN43062.1 biotin-dependent enzyme [Blastococcus colisei]
MEIVVPKWGVTMDEAHLVVWLKKVGDLVTEDEPVAEMETDKADAEIVSQVSGRITELLVEEGAQVEAGQVIARVEATSGDPT